MIAQSVLLNESFHCPTRWQQLFSYQGNHTAKVLLKALEPVQLGIFTGCAVCECVPDFFSLSSFSVSLSSLPHPPRLFLLSGKVQPWLTFLLDPSLSVLKCLLMAEVIRLQHPRRFTWLKVETMEAQVTLNLTGQDFFLW